MHYINVRRACIVAAAIAVSCLALNSPVANAYGPQGCSSTWIAPEITAHGRSTAVWFGVNFLCSRPVEYNLTVVAYAGSGGVSAGEGHNSGVSTHPAVSALSRPCRSNRNDLWTLSLTGWIEDPNGTRHQLDDEPGSWYSGATVGCSI